MTARRRIVLATDSLEPSGVGEHMLALAHALANSFETTVAAPLAASGDFLARAAGLGLAAHGYDDDDNSFFRDRRYDLAHVHAGIGWEGHGLTRAAAAAGVPVVVRTEHLPYLLTDPEQIAEHRHAVARLDALVCVSQASCESYVTAGIARHLVAVVRNGIVPAQPRRARAATRAALGVDEGHRLAITVARLTPQKNHAALIAAMEIVVGRQPQARLVLVGAGPLEAALRDAAAPLGEAVMFLGARDDVPDLLAAADLFVLPSLFEGMPLSLIEAMAAGLPVVASDIGGVDELVMRGTTGLLAPSDRLAEPLLDLLHDRARAAAMGQAGRQRFQSLFSSARMARETAAVYRRAGLGQASPRLQHEDVAWIG